MRQAGITELLAFLENTYPPSSAEDKMFDQSQETQKDKRVCSSGRLRDLQMHRHAL